MSDRERENPMSGAPHRLATFETCITGEGFKNGGFEYLWIDGERYSVDYIAGLVRGTEQIRRLRLRSEAEEEERRRRK
jgi:hypothetical protein